ncbi:MAG: hypothetical protein RLN59_01745 [Haliea sp.]
MAMNTPSMHRDNDTRPLAILVPLLSGIALFVVIQAWAHMAPARHYWSLLCTSVFLVSAQFLLGWRLRGLLLALLHTDRSYGVATARLVGAAGLWTICLWPLRNLSLQLVSAKAISPDPTREQTLVAFSFHGFGLFFFVCCLIVLWRAVAPFWSLITSRASEETPEP